MHCAAPWRLAAAASLPGLALPQRRTRKKLVQRSQYWTKDVMQEFQLFFAAMGRVRAPHSWQLAGGNTLASTAGKAKKAVLRSLREQRAPPDSFSGPLLGSPPSSLLNAADAGETAWESLSLISA